ncbi:hypothetical protein HMPREF1981_00953 [Bacteroides pyogenes F0041]|uniref:SusD family protein n=1 Tax=Bacteroides pyogenes F0041 TaxID=1321819 RepID=U2DXH2_9BACE|nr:RagB/SusD family nutrient uptake outer membrane protein [Bacteroides pyogenes]ERI86362.1 hypothetical protein HMPREF1981_00953 [Bacteroides pyogenes F0041]
MKKRLHIFPFILILCMLNTACDEFLNVHPKSEKLERELFKNAQGFEDAINGVYGSMQRTQLYGKDLVWGIPEVLAQNLNGQSTEMTFLAKYDYTNNDDLRQRLSDTWTYAYQTIGYANNILNQLNEKSEQDLPLYNFYKGEMLGVRALLHFELLRMFAPMNMDARGIPYLKAYSYKVQDFGKVGENYASILTDLHEAEKLLKDDEEGIAYPRNNKKYSKFLNYRETHFNLYAVYGLLARVYWMKGDMPNAAVYAQKIIESGKFPLVGEIEVQDFLAGVLSPKETIFGIYSVSYLKTSRSYLYNFHSFFSYNPYYDGSGSNHLLPYNAVFDKDTEEGSQDFRRNQFKELTGYVKFLKLVDYYTIENNVPTERKDMIPGVTVMHSSEMYLIAAEALLETNYSKALEYFNSEITSRGLPRLKDHVKLTKEMIFNEYHKELFGEGQIWYNMKRLNRDIVSNAETRVIKGSDKVYVIPVPKEEFEYRFN